ncbi:MAG: hypothetical protein Q4P29_07310 [Tissierellia bacterium]|nr:hypothetical protein [Tissierellia bacterium]
MKKTLLIVLALILCLTLVACGGEKPKPENKENAENKVEEPAEKPEEKPEEKPVATKAEEGVAQDYWYGDWEGYLYIPEAWGEHIGNKDLFIDMNGVISTDSGTYLDFIEVFLPDQEEDPILSFYVEITDEGIKPIFDEEYAEDSFYFNRTLTTDDSIYFETPNTKASPTIKYEYKFEEPDDPDSGSRFIIVLKKVGESWDNEEKKPPKFQ